MLWEQVHDLTVLWEKYSLGFFIYYIVSWHHLVPAIPVSSFLTFDRGWLAHTLRFSIVLMWFLEWGERWVGLDASIFINKIIKWLNQLFINKFARILFLFLNFNALLAFQDLNWNWLYLRVDSFFVLSVNDIWF